MSKRVPRLLAVAALMTAMAGGVQVSGSRRRVRFGPVA